MDIKSHVISKCGGVVAVAEMLGITPGAVSQWKDYIPAHHQSKLLEEAPKRNVSLKHSDFFRIPKTNNGHINGKNGKVKK